MVIPQRPIGDTADPRWQWRLTDDGSYTLVQVATGDAMHSGCGALEETRHVYLVGSGAAERLRQRQATRIWELGFGSGLGWLVTADWALRHGAPLDYVGLDVQLPPADVVRQLDWDRAIANHRLVQATLDWFGEAERAIGRSTAIPPLQLDSVRLELVLSDALAWCRQQLAADESVCGQPFDAIYFDPFSPQAAPQLWSPEVFRALRRIIRPGGRLASYCVNRRVRDDMASAGWRVQRVPGPVDGKREVLTAEAVDHND